MGARPIWKGHISFGLVNVPVTLYPLENRASEVHLRMVDKRDMAPVKYQRVNEATGDEVPWESVGKAYEVDEGRFVPVTEEELREVKAKGSKVVEIEDFVPGAEIDPAFFDKPYVMVPGKQGEKGYALLREVLRRSGRVGVSRVVIRTKQYLAALTAHGPALYLLVMRYADELRGLSEFELPGEDLAALKVSERELELAEKLVAAMEGPWKPEKYRDEYQDTLRKTLEEKAAAGQVTAAPTAGAETTATNVVDLMDYLKRSVEEAAKKRGGAGEGAPREGPKTGSAEGGGKKKGGGRRKPKAA